MASDLQQVANAVRHLADEAGDPMRLLASAHHDLGRLAQRASQLPDAQAAHLQEALDAARNKLLDVFEALTDFKNGATQFAERLVGGAPAPTGGGEGALTRGPEGRRGSPETQTPEFPSQNHADADAARSGSTLPDRDASSALGSTALLGAVASAAPANPVPTAASHALGSVAVQGAGVPPVESGTPSGMASAPATGDPVSAASVSARGSQSALAPYWSKYGDEFVPQNAWDWVDVPASLPRHSAPAAFAEWSNDGGVSVPGRDVNCVNCAMAVESNWRGHPQVSAARATRMGEPSRERLPAHYRKPFERSDFSDIATRLTAAGPGSSAIVRVRWNDGAGGDAGGHCFNAVNYQGVVYFVDGQRGVQDLWPPRASSGGRNDGYGSPEVLDWATEALYFGADD